VTDGDEQSGPGTDFEILFDYFGSDEITSSGKRLLTIHSVIHPVGRRAARGVMPTSRMAIDTHRRKFWITTLTPPRR
jgi:hypothetical protein